MNGPATPTAAVEFRQVVKAFGSSRAVDALSFHVETGTFTALLGPSGCGKTTTLRLIAGLDHPDQGSVFIDGVDVTDVAPERRGLGLVPQNYALFPHLTVAANVGFGLRMRGCARGLVGGKVADALALVQMQDFGARYPAQLSGGQQQRVALARALAVEPKVLLLDEPMAALDRKLRAKVQLDIRALQRRLGVTTIMVTHDQEEAMIMADRIAVMDQGRIVQYGTPSEVYSQPRTRFVSDFIGRSNTLPAKGPGSVVSIVRPEAVRLCHTHHPDGALSGRVVDAVFLGPVTYYHIELADGSVMVAMEGGVAGPGQRPSHRVGDMVSAAWDPDQEHSISGEAEAT